MLSEDLPDTDAAPAGSAPRAADPDAGASSPPRDEDLAPDGDLRPDEDLLSRLEIVESQPLADRAAAYEAIHEDLARRLEQSPESPRP